MSAPGAAVTSTDEYREPFLSGAFLPLWIGQIVSIFGDYLFRFSILSYVVSQGSRPFARGAALGLAVALPIAAFSGLAGVVVDRRNRFAVLVATDVVRALLVLAALPLLGTGREGLVAIYALTFLLTLTGLPFQPALGSTMPEVVARSRGRLETYNALLYGTTPVLGIVGPTAGAVLGLHHVRLALVLDAVTFVVSAVLIRVARRRVGANAGVPLAIGPRRGVFQSLRDGLRVIRGDIVLHSQLPAFALADAVTSALTYLLPGLLLARRVSDAAGFGVALSAVALGRVLGMVVARPLRARVGAGRLLFVNFFVQSLCVAGVLGAHSLPAVSLWFCLLGLPSGIAQIVFVTYVQSRVADQYRGRTFAALAAASSVLAPIGPLVFGALADGLGAEACLTAMVATLLLAGAWVASHRNLRAVV